LHRRRRAPGGAGRRRGSVGSHPAGRVVRRGGRGGVFERADGGRQGSFSAFAGRGGAALERPSGRRTGRGLVDRLVAFYHSCCCRLDAVDQARLGDGGSLASIIRRNDPRRARSAGRRTAPPPRTRAAAPMDGPVADSGRLTAREAGSTSSTARKAS